MRGRAWQTVGLLGCAVLWTGCGAPGTSRPPPAQPPAEDTRGASMDESPGPAENDDETVSPPDAEKPVAPLDLPLAAVCKPAKDPSVKLLDAFNGCTVSFTSVDIEPARGCTKMACSAQRPCCNGCRAGGMKLHTQGVSLSLTRGGQGLRCQAGSSCPAAGDCELDPGVYDVTGVVSRVGEGSWQLDLQQVAPRTTRAAVSVPPVDPGACRAGPIRLLTPDSGDEDLCRVQLTCGQELNVSAQCSAQSCFCAAGAWFTYFERDPSSSPEAACQSAIPRCLSKLTELSR